MTKTNDSAGGYQATPPADRRDPYGTGIHQVVAIGSGFGGLFATKALRRADADTRA